VKLLAAEPVEAEGTPARVLDDALTIACGEGALRAVSVQRAGRGVSSADELLGFAIPAGTRRLR
jgi:methionyl-tRNA formyltransferase